MKNFTQTLLVLTALSGAASAHSWRAADSEKEAERAHILAEWERDHGPVPSATPRYK
jgi:hypothetical protein